MKQTALEVRDETLNLKIQNLAGLGAELQDKLIELRLQPHRRVELIRNFLDRSDLSLQEKALVMDFCCGMFEVVRIMESWKPCEDSDEILDLLLFYYDMVGELGVDSLEAQMRVFTQWFAEIPEELRAKVIAVLIDAIVATRAQAMLNDEGIIPCDETTEPAWVSHREGNA